VSLKQLLVDGATDNTLPELLVQSGHEAAVRRDSTGRAAELHASGLSLRSNFAWVLTGNLVYAACQWGIIVALAKLGNSFMVGQFSLGLAIATPVLMFTNLHLRAVQATDARRLYSFAEYFQLRSVMTLAAIVVIAGIAWFENYGRQTTLIILAVALAKGIEALSDIHYGLFQLNDRLDQTGISMMFRGALAVVAVGAGLYLTHDVFWGCIAVALVWLASFLLFDVRRGRRFVSHQFCEYSNLSGWQECNLLRLQRQWNLMRLALPLGLVTTLASVNLNMPRYFIEARIGVHQLGVFSALAYATVVLTLVSDSLGHCAIPRLSRFYADGRFKEFRSLLLQMSAIGAALGLGSLVVAQGMGTWILHTVYGSEYAAASRIFVVLMIATAIHCVAGMFTSGIMSARCFRVQVPIFALVVASTALACYRLVPASGLLGAAKAMVVGAVVRLLLAAAVAAYVLMVHARRGAKNHVPLATVEEWNPSV
jgi:O-antigen/teichoic acid export membrane protein